jgi:hypothetical protein
MIFGGVLGHLRQSALFVVALAMRHGSSRP